MVHKIQTIEHHKIISDFRLLSGLTVSIEDCANLTKELKKYGVEDYYISDYEGNSYLTRYVDYFIDGIPCLKYKKKYLIPLIFRDMPDTAFLIFRLWEICDGAAFPIANLNNLSEFERWNQIFHLIDTGKSFKRTREFDATKVEDLTQLEAVITIIKMKYQAILQKQGYQV